VSASVPAVEVVCVLSAERCTPGEAEVRELRLLARVRR
jgi:hypothetical protein